MITYPVTLFSKRVGRPYPSYPVSTGKVFGIAGDNHMTYRDNLATLNAKATIRRIPDYIIHVGDVSCGYNINATGESQYWNLHRETRFYRRWLPQWTNGGFSQFDPQSGEEWWGDLERLSECRFFPVFGNHDDDAQPSPPTGEASEDAIIRFNEYFDLDNAVSDGWAVTTFIGPYNTRNFIARIGDVEIYSLNYWLSNQQPGELYTNPNLANFRWGISYAATSGAKWKILLTHKPPYDSYLNHSDIEVGILQHDWKALGFDMVISGHEHIHEVLYTKFQGTGENNLYIVNGLGGGYRVVLGFTEPPKDGSRYRLELSTEEDKLKEFAVFLETYQNFILVKSVLEGSLAHVFRLTKTLIPSVDLEAEQEELSITCDGITINENDELYYNDGDDIYKKAGATVTPITSDVTGVIGITHRGANRYSLLLSTSIMEVDLSNYSEIVEADSKELPFTGITTPASIAYAIEDEKYYISEGKKIFICSRNDFQDSEAATEQCDLTAILANSITHLFFDNETNELFACDGEKTVKLNSTLTGVDSTVENGASLFMIRNVDRKCLMI